MSRPVVSIVIPAYNQARLLRRLLDSIAAMTDGPPFEVIVVDDASPDDTGAVVTAWIADHPPIPCRYLRQDRNQGPGAARNRGLEDARGEFVAFTDTDCVVGERWLARLVAGFTSDDIAGVGGHVEPWNPESRFARYNTVNASLQPIASEAFPIPYLVTCNALFRRDALVAAGAFPHDIPTPGGEDVGASIALFKRGGRFAFARDAIVRHDYRDSWRSFARTWRNYGYGCGVVARRMLTPEESNPEAGRWLPEHHWDIRAVRPTVTGVRSMLRDLRTFWTRTSGQSLELPERVALLAVRAVERIAYYIGWRKGFRG